MQLTYFPQSREFAFIRDPSTLKPTPLGPDRIEYFATKENAIYAAKESGYFVREDGLALMH